MDFQMDAVFAQMHVQLRTMIRLEEQLGSLRESGRRRGREETGVEIPAPPTEAADGDDDDDVAPPASDHSARPAAEQQTIKAWIAGFLPAWLGGKK
jgi:hypothetical protein